MTTRFAAVGLAAALFGQSMALCQKPPAFDAASVKMRERAGPGTMMRETPGHIDYVGIPLLSPLYQIKVNVEAYGGIGLTAHLHLLSSPGSK